MAHTTKATEQPVSSNRRRNNRGLTTLEWLLIVAAVAGLAALAVVLVQNVVDDTAEQISGSSARLTAALIAAQEITDDANAATNPIPEPEAKAKCDRLRITYGDAFDDSEKTKVATWYAASPSAQPSFGGATVSPAADATQCRIIDKT